RSPPPGMKETDDALGRVDQVYWDAVRYRHHEHDAGCGREVAINAFVDSPAARPLVPRDLDAVYLMRHDEAGESRFSRPKRAPPTHHASHRLSRPQSKVEAPIARSSPGNPGDNAGALAPGGDFVAGHGAGQWSLRNGAFSHPAARSPRQDPAVARRSA